MTESLPNSWPPIDFETEKHQMDLLSKNSLSPQTFALITKLGQSQRLFLYLFIDFVLIVAAIAIFGGWEFAVVAVIVRNVISSILVRRTLRQLPVANEHEVQRNKDLYTFLYDGVKSNIIATRMLVWLVSEKNIDIYHPSWNDMIDNVKKEVVSEDGIFRKDCRQGHSGLCQHRIPGEVLSWFTSPDSGKRIG